MAQLKNKHLKALSDKVFAWDCFGGWYTIEACMSAYILKKDGEFMGSIIPWLSTKKKLKIQVPHKSKPLTLKTYDIIFIDSDIQLSN